MCILEFRSRHGRCSYLYYVYTLLRPPSDRSCGPRVPCSRDVAQASGIPYLIIWAEGTGVRRARYIRVVTDGADGMIDSVYEFSSSRICHGPPYQHGYNM